MINRKYLAMLFYVHRSLTMDCVLLVAAIIELACWTALGVPEIGFMAAGGFLFFVALDLVQVVRFERRYNPKRYA